MNLVNLLDVLANRKLHARMKFRGLDISIENRKGSVRKGVDHDGKKWSVKMTAPYGYILRTEGVDGDHVDCFVGPNENAKQVYVIHVKNLSSGGFDEDKCMIGFESAIEAKKVFLENYSNPDFYGGMDSISWDKFKEKVLATKDNPQKLVASRR
jgi:hypothetical protein